MENSVFRDWCFLRVPFVWIVCVRVRFFPILFSCELSRSGWDFHWISSQYLDSIQQICAWSATNDVYFGFMFRVGTTSVAKITNQLHCRMHISSKRYIHIRIQNIVHTRFVATHNNRQTTRKKSTHSAENLLWNVVNIRVFQFDFGSVGSLILR